MTLGGLFLLYLAALATVLGTTFQVWLGTRTAWVATALLAIWLAYAGALGWLGVVGDTSLRPPGIAILLIPVVVFIATVFVRSRAGLRLALDVPLWLLIGLQTFRIGVEWFIQHLHDAGLLPRLMTLEGGNFELAIAVSAPVVAWVATRGASGRRFALGWSMIGIVSLLNVAARAVLTSPEPLHLIHSEVPNIAMGTFPFTFIPGFFAPLAVALHVLAIRSILARQRGKADGSESVTAAA